MMAHLILNQIKGTNYPGLFKKILLPTSIVKWNKINHVETRSIANRWLKNSNY